MRFLIDQNLPVRLVDTISAFNHEVGHVRLMGLASASDTEIWAFAKAKGMAVVSKDKDFLVLARRDAVVAGCPRLVHLNLGNCSNEALYDIVRRDWTMVVARLMAGEVILEVCA